MALQRIAYSQSGSFLVLADGADLLVHAGEDEGPRWHRALGGEIAAVGATSAEIIALTAGGALSFWRGADGEALGEVELGAPASALAVTADGACAAALPEEVAICRRDGERRALPLSGATAVAWSGDGARVAAGDSEGRVRVVAAEDGAAVGEAALGVPIRSLAWNAGGFWVATGGEQVFRVAADGSEHAQLTRASGFAPDCAACSAGGELLALRLGPALVVVLALPSKDTVATVEYVEREVVGLAFGPAPFLGIGLDRGDGNKINLRTQAVHRTDPHPGRPRNRWLLSVSVDPKPLPRTYAAPAAALGSAAGPEAPLPASHGAVMRAVTVALAIVAVVILLSRFG